jgi:hypothetical protein
MTLHNFIDLGGTSCLHLQGRTVCHALKNDTIIGKGSPFWVTAFLRKFCQTCLFHCELDHPVFTSLDFTTVIFFSTEQGHQPCIQPPPGGPDLCIYVLQWECGPVITPANRFPFHRLLWLAGLRWRYLNLPPHRMKNGISTGADKSLAFPISYFPICSTTKRVFLGWVKEVKTTKW